MEPTNAPCHRHRGSVQFQASLSSKSRFSASPEPSSTTETSSPGKVAYHRALHPDMRPTFDVRRSQEIVSGAVRPLSPRMNVSSRPILPTWKAGTLAGNGI